MKLHALIVPFALTACSGDVVIDPDNDGGGGTNSTKPIGCSAHDQCGPGNLCVFETGACTPSCQMDSCDACGPGTVCSECATSSCAGCSDCMAGCVAAEPFDCDDDDPCDPAFTCLFSQRQCTTTCSPEIACPGDGMECDGCAVGSCCACKACRRSSGVAAEWP